MDIIWEGYSFDDEHEISDSGEQIPMLFNIVSKTGLTTLKIEIISDVLNADELGALAQKMDLINPATPIWWRHSKSWASRQAMLWRVRLS